MKAKRQEAIKKIITKNPIKTQGELVTELKRQGFQVTQATVSRDIGELKLGRAKLSNGANIYILLEEKESLSSDRLTSFYRDFGLGVVANQNLVLIRTTPGGAQGLAKALDDAGFEEVMGTIAGDDTILVVTKSNETSKKLTKKLNKLKK